MPRATDDRTDDLRPPGLTTLAYTAPAGSPSADSLRLPASWAATAEQGGELPLHTRV